MKNLQLSSFLSFMLIMIAQSSQGASTKVIGPAKSRPTLRRTGAADYNTQTTMSLQNRNPTIHNQKPANTIKQPVLPNNPLNCERITPTCPTSFLTQRPTMESETVILRSGVREVNNFYKQTITKNIDQGNFSAAQKLLTERIEQLNNAIKDLAGDQEQLLDRYFFENEKDGFIELQVQLNKKLAYHAQNSSSTIQPLNQK